MPHAAGHISTTGDFSPEPLQRNKIKQYLSDSKNDSSSFHYSMTLPNIPCSFQENLVITTSYTDQKLTFSEFSNLCYICQME